MIFGLTIGSFATTYFMSIIINMVVTKNQEKTKKRLLLNRIEEYMLYRRFPDYLQRHIREYVRLVNNNTFTDERTILNALSPELRKKCTMFNFGEMLRRIPFLRACDSRHKSYNVAHFGYFIEELALQMRTVYYAADDLILKKNDFADRCWFIEIGTAKIFKHVADEKKLYKQLEVGQYVGETALLSDSFVIDYYVRAMSWVGMVTLDHAAFAEVLSLYPVIRHYISRWIKQHRHRKINHSTITYASIIDEMQELSDGEDRRQEENEDSGEIGIVLNPLREEVEEEEEEEEKQKATDATNTTKSIGTQTKTKYEDDSIV